MYKISDALGKAEVRGLVRRGASPFGLLLIACRFNSLPLAKLALKQGVDLNQRDRESWTPLMHAAYYNNWEILDFLLDHNALVHKRGSQGESALEIAREEENQEVLEVFNRHLSKVRMKHAGILIKALKTLWEEGGKPRESRDKLCIALAYIDRAWVWWVGGEYPHKVLQLFKRAYEVEPAVGAFPYASILAGLGYKEEALDLLELVQQRGWKTVMRKVLVESGLFQGLENSPRWTALLLRWPDAP